MKEIPLCQREGQIIDYAFVSDEHFIELDKFKW